jgi:hypothetical protein
MMLLEPLEQKNLVANGTNAAEITNEAQSYLSASWNSDGFTVLAELHAGVIC